MPLQQYIAAFARTGNPNQDGLLNWPAYAAPDHAYLRLTNQGPVIETGLGEPQCDWFVRP
jgi:carboxylesterase type B